MSACIIVSIYTHGQKKRCNIKILIKYYFFIGEIFSLYTNVYLVELIIQVRLNDVI
jgi:hypothetical protein